MAANPAPLSVSSSNDGNRPEEEASPASPAMAAKSFSVRSNSWSFPQQNTRQSISGTRAILSKTISNGTVVAEDHSWEELCEELLPKYFGEVEYSEDEIGYSEAQLQQAIYAYENFVHMSNHDGVDEIEDVLRYINPNFTVELVQKAWAELARDQQRVLSAVTNLFSAEVFKDSKKLAISRFQLDGTGPVREVALVPSKMMVAPKQVKELMSKKCWNLSPPDKLVTFDYGTRHKTDMMTLHQIQQPAFKKLRTSAEQAVKSRQDQAVSSTSIAGKSELEQMMDSFMEELLEEVTQAVVEASFMSSSWVVIDRRSHTNSSETAEHFLECCKATTGKPPVFLVLESISRFKAFKPSKEVVKQLLVLGNIIANASPLEEPSTPISAEKMYSLQDFQSWEKFQFEEGLTTATLDADSFEKGNVWLPRKPEEKLVHKDQNGKVKLLNDGRPSVTKQLKWIYHYQQYLYQSGSHYIIFEDADTSSFPMRTAGNEDWPEAKIFACGESLAFDRVLHAFKAGIPSVLLGNTGGATQIFASLYKMCVEEKNNWLQAFENPNKEILENIMMSMSGEETFINRVGPGTVDLMLRLERRAPEKMRRAYATVNVLKDSAEKVIEKVTGCFASGGVGLPELGLGSAEEDLVLIAWQLSMAFDKAAWMFRLKADILYYVSMLFTMITGILCVKTLMYRTDLENNVLFPDGHLPIIRGDFTAVDAVDTTLVLLPIVSTFVTGILSKKRYLQKWAVFYDISRKMVKEIYEFRTRTSEYDTTRLATMVEEDEEQGDEAEGGEQSAKPALNPASQLQARDYFAQAISLLQKAALTEVADDSLCGGGTGALIDLSDREAKMELEEEIAHFVKERLFRGVPGGGEICLEALHASLVCKLLSACWACCTRRNKISKVAPSDKGGMAARADGALKGLTKLSMMGKDNDDEISEDEDADDEAKIVRDDYKSTMTIETYIEHRLKPLLQMSKRKTPQLANTLSRFEITILAMNAATAFIAAMNYTDWVAVVVLLLTAISNLLQYKLINQRLTSHNSAIKELESLNTFLSSLSIVQRRMHTVKNMAVSVAESASLETVQAWTGISSSATNRKTGDTTRADGTSAEDSGQNKNKNKNKEQ
eukprot:TRINITY_DN8797_c0_g1_i1.p1 TRINITY_DN8797_c0_g1~~TRINITY_DN8797_c0_g1_i1.p1  ORF type:complete len:1113 (-),score=238.73 TRINITY_DN8797_c0_g1_i1:92-3430(-)